MKIRFEPHRDKTNKTAYAPNEDSDKPGHLPSLTRVFAVRLKKAWVLGYPLSAQRRFWSDWADAQADLSLRWAYMPFCWFCHDAAHLKRTRRLMYSVNEINATFGLKVQYSLADNCEISRKYAIYCHCTKMGRHAVSSNIRGAFEKYLAYISLTGKQTHLCLVSF